MSTNQTESEQLPAPVSGLEIEKFSAFGSLSQFKNAQRMASLLAHSSIVPDTYKGDAHIGDCVIALEIANRIGASVLAVMQNLYIVHGKPGWSSQFLISCINASRRFSPLRYHMTGTVDQDDWGCIAWALDKRGERLESPRVTIGMAKSEGWYGKNGSKWKTMPELMLHYRSATLFARLYAPELTMGIQTTEEIIDIDSVTTVSRPVFDAPKALKPVPPMFPQVPPSITQEPAALPQKNAPGESNPPPAPSAKPVNFLRAINGLMKSGNVKEAELLAFMRGAGLVDDSLTSLEEIAMISPSALEYVHEKWAMVDKDIKAQKGAVK